MRDNIYVGVLISEREFLSHHGINGQKWGVRNGPPYPLSSDAKSSSEKKSAGGHKKQEYGDAVTAAIILSMYLFPWVAIAGAAAVDEAVKARQEKKYTAELNKKREAAGLKKDEATGFYKKKKQNSIEEDAKNVNPRFEESRKKGDTRYTTNCMLCTTTFEMRRRGYEVEAKPREAWMRTGSDTVKRWFPGAATRMYRPEGNDLYYRDYSKMKKEAKKDILSQGEGARGNLMITWQGSAGAGHSVFYEVHNKKITIVDTQCNRVLPNSDMIFDRASSIVVSRLDDAKFDPDAIKECCR